MCGGGACGVDVKLDTGADFVDDGVMYVDSFNVYVDVDVSCAGVASCLYLCCC